MDRTDRVVILLRPPAEFPAPTADRPRAEPDAGDLQAGTAELVRPEPRLLHRASIETKLLVSLTSAPAKAFPCPAGNTVWMLEAVSHLRPGRSGPVRDRSCSSSDCCAAWWLRGT